MIEVSFPTSKDIYIEINGKKLAVIESYKSTSKRESRHIEAFGENESVGTIPGKIKYYVEISRIYMCDTNMNSEIDFYNLSDFNLTIVKPDKRILYSNCEWTQISESAGINDTLIESLSLIASSRMELI
ncbi:MAG: hypothetical protein Q4B14_06540 [Clostridia bacterium]|nr:hypothetical protein [Clostridia bacterium]